MLGNQTLKIRVAHGAILISGGKARVNNLHHTKVSIVDGVISTLDAIRVQDSCTHGTTAPTLVKQHSS
jgi:hypothetical protein